MVPRRREEAEEVWGLHRRLSWAELLRQVILRGGLAGSAEEEAGALVLAPALIMEAEEAGDTPAEGGVRLEAQEAEVAVDVVRA